MNFGGAAGAAVFRLQRPGKRCGRRRRPKTTCRDHSQLTPPSDVQVRLTFFTPREPKRVPLESWPAACDDQIPGHVR
jgi:hypothetical protein